VAFNTRPVPSFTYFGSQADHLVNRTASHLQNAFDRIRQAVHDVGDTVRSVKYGLRQEVPFERWFFDHGFQTPLTHPSALISAHIWAVIAAGEGGIRTTIEATTYVFSLVFEPKESDRHLDILKAQWQGFTLSLLAILSPNTAKRAADNNGQPLIGSSIFTWTWGTPYAGKLDKPLWHSPVLVPTPDRM
jgi:hypothetical protein